MRINKITLKNYLPMSAVSEIDEITILLEADLQLILGSNGCGKSSLLRVLNPLPADRKEFTKGGYCRLEITSGQNSYTISSEFATSARYHFIRNGEELNKSGNLTSQRELAESEFRYTPMIHRLLTGDLAFTQMSPSQRRETLTLISPLDLGYVTDLFNSIATASRDSSGALKHVQAKQSDAIASLSTLDYTEGLETTRMELETILDDLVRFTIPQINKTSIIENQITTNTAMLDKIWGLWQDYKPLTMPAGVQSHNGLVEHIGSIQSNITNAQHRIDELTIELSDLSGTVNDLTDGYISLEELTTAIERMKAERDSYKCEYTFAKEYEYMDYPNVLGGLDKVLKHTNEIVSRNVTYFSRDEITLKRELVLELQVKDRNHNAVITRTKQSIEHLTADANGVICDGCKKRFSVLQTDIHSELNIMKRKLATEEQQAAKNQEHLELARADMVLVNDYLTAAEHLGSIRTTIKLPYDFWENAPAMKQLLVPGILSNYICVYRKWVAESAAVNKLTTDILKYQEAIAVHKRYGGKLSERIGRCEQLISKQQEIQEANRATLAECKRILKDYEFYTKITDDCERLINEVSVQTKELTNALIRDDATVICSKVYDRLAGIRQVIKQKVSLESAIVELEKDQAKLVTDKAGYDILVKNLSPNKGIIADQMLGFINSFMGEVNKICERIWGYSLRVDSCCMANGVLDYKFPMIVESSVIPDVRHGSSGQQDVIDLAFTLVMRQYLELTDYPLYLDETGASFDETHRTNLMRYIQGLLELNQCSQVFMINHYATIFGGLANNDIVVLDERNITVPSTYNVNTTIVRQ